MGGTTMTELADTLVREHEMPFKTAHAITAQVLKVRGQHPDAKPTETLAAVAFELVGRPITYSEERLQEILSPRYFVTVRKTPGGPAPEETGRAADASGRQARHGSRVARGKARRDRGRARGARREERRLVKRGRRAR